MSTNTRILFLFAFLAAAIPFTPSAAGETSGPQETLDRFSSTAWVAGQPVTMTWPEGKAMLMYSRSAVNQVELGLAFQDGDCTDFHQNVTCRFHTAFRYDTLSLRWVENSDPKMNGTVVQVRPKSDSGSEPQNMEWNIGWFPIARRFAPVALRDFPEQEYLTCDDYRIFPRGSVDQPPESLSIARWEFELMFPNPETNSNENRTYGGYLDVSFRTNATRPGLWIQRVENTSNKLGFLVPPALVGDISAMHIRSWNTEGAEDICSLSFVPSSSASIDELSKLMDETAELKPYLWEQDELVAAIIKQRAADFSSITAELERPDPEADKPDTSLPLHSSEILRIWLGMQR